MYYERFKNIKLKCSNKEEKIVFSFKSRNEPGKTAYFLLFTVAGLLVYLLMNELLFKNQPAMVNLNLKGFRVVLSGIQIGFFVGASILAIVTQLVAFFARKAIPVVGAIYSFCQGFIISFLVFSILVGYEYLGLLALAITIVIVMVMAVLYSTRIIKASKKFHMVMISLFAGMIGISIFYFLVYRISHPVHKTLCRFDPRQFPGLFAFDDNLAAYRDAVPYLGFRDDRACCRKQNARKIRVDGGVRTCIHSPLDLCKSP